MVNKFSEHLLCTKHIFFNSHLSTYCVLGTIVVAGVTVTDKTDKIISILLVSAHLLFTVTLQGITIQATYEKIK